MPTVLESLNNALHRLLETDPRVYVLGEDILDPYGGAFKVTRGLSTRFPDRVLSTPISEAALVGIATGMALRGLRPIVEIMFGDFLTLTADQIINHAAKFRWVYNDQVRVPLVIRTPMGGRRGYGPTHSQSLEKLFLGVPGLKVVAPSALDDVGALLEAAVADEDPVLFIEHKLLYPRPCLAGQQEELTDYRMNCLGAPFPTWQLQLTFPHTPHLTIATYGYNLEIVRPAIQALLMEHEIFAEVLVFSELAPFDLEPLFASLRRTRRLLTVEESTLTLGWGAEVAARAAQVVGGLRVRRVAALDLPIANARPLEDRILPSTQNVIQAALALREA